jgi:hypothetical protein
VKLFRRGAIGPFFSFLDPDSTAHCAVCERCGFVHMFIPSGTVCSDEKALD